jgi:hypothetical protein
LYNQCTLKVPYYQSEQYLQFRMWDELTTYIAYIYFSTRWDVLIDV